MSDHVQYQLPAAAHPLVRHSPLPSGGSSRRRLLVGAGASAVALAAFRFGQDRNDAQVFRDISLAAAPAPPPPPPPTDADRAEWRNFASRYVAQDGRVIDTGNANVSHSEGQGWGLLGAQAADDPAGFARILAWTRQNLQRRPNDALHAWRYRPTEAMPVADFNNATDGDLYIAGALARAAIRWGRPDYAAAAGAIARGILDLVRVVDGRSLLLPGAFGFEPPGAYTINLSYYTFALFPDLAAVAPSPVWNRLQRDGLAMILQSRFGRWGLPPDWLQVQRSDGAISIAPAWPARFSYDAIRVPLHLAWARLAAAPMLDAFDQYWTALRPMPPAWVDLKSGEIAPYPAPAGMRAVAAVVSASYQGSNIALPSINLATDYYSAGLVILARVASRDRLL